MEYIKPDEQIEITTRVPIYKPFPGRNIEQMPLLLGEGRVPVWGSRFMRQRKDFSHKFPELIGYQDLGDLFAYDDKKRSTDVKFILTVDNQGKLTDIGRKALSLINPNTKLTSDYAIPLGEQYDALSGNGIFTLKRSELGILGQDLTEDQIISSKPWRIAMRHPDEVPAEFAEDKGLLREYAQWVASQTKLDKNMGVYLDSNSDVAKLRAAVVGRLGYWSWLYGWGLLDYDDGRLVGYLAPEAQNALGIAPARPSLETVLNIVNEHWDKLGIVLRTG